MNAAPSSTAEHIHPAQVNNSIGIKEMSFGFLSGGEKPRTFDAHLRDAWVTLINKHFDSPEQAAVFFGVSEKTARNWATGSCGPRGGPVAYAMKRIPGAATMLLGET